MFDGIWVSDGANRLRVNHRKCAGDENQREHYKKPTYFSHIHSFIIFSAASVNLDKKVMICDD
jgi:hypothetical protein